MCAEGRYILQTVDAVEEVQLASHVQSHEPIEEQASKQVREHAYR